MIQKFAMKTDYLFPYIRTKIEKLFFSVFLLNQKIYFSYDVKMIK